MTRQRLTALLLCAALLLGCGGCAKGGESSDASTDPGASASADSGAESASVSEAEPVEEQKEEAMPFGLGYYKDLGLNPYTCDNAQNQSIMGLLYEPLFELDQSFNATPVLAESISAKTRTDQRVVMEKKKTESGETETVAATETDKNGEKKVKTRSVAVTDVTVHIRKGVHFSDGSTLRADDVEYSLERAAAKGSVYHSRLSGISNVRTSGSSTVKFTLDGGCASVAELLDVPIVKNGQGEKDFPIGSGPYVVKRNKKGRPVRLEANESWWRQGQTYEVALSQGVSVGDSSNGEGMVTLTVNLPLKTIRLYTASDSDELIFGFSSGAVTAVRSDLTGTDALQYTGSYDVTDFPTSDLLYLGCNTAKGACKEQAVRAAIYQSVDRGKLVERMMAGHAREARLPVSDKSSLYDAELAESLDYSLKKAKKLCKEAGVSSELTLIVNKDAPFKVAAAKETARELKSAGLNVKTQTLSWKEYREALKAGNYDLYFGEVRLGANFDLSVLLTKGGSLNFSGYESEELSKAEKAYRTAGRDTRTAAAKTLFTQLSQEAPFVPLCFKSQSVLSRRGTVLRSRATQSNLFASFWEWVIDDAVLTASNSAQDE